MEKGYDRDLFDENALCEICGNMGALRIGDHLICESCYHDYGTCCVEFAGNDLTKVYDERKTA